MEGKNNDKRHLNFFVQFRIFLSEKQFIIGITLFVIVFVLYLNNPVVIYNSTEELADKDMRCNAVIEKKEATPIEIDNTTIYRLTYKYSAGNKNYTGTDYAATSKKEGDEIRIAYSSSFPEESTIVTTLIFVHLGVLPVFFVMCIVAYIFMFLSIKKSAQTLQIVKNGITTRGRVLNRKQKGVSLTGNAAYSLLCRYYNTWGEEYVENLWISGRLNEKFGPYITILYHPDKPEEARIFDSLPKYIRNCFDE